MCPLKDSCPKVRKSRWPDSSIKTVTKFGALCPYAHHLMELEFPESLHAKIAATKGQKQKTMQSVDKESLSQPFLTASLSLWKDKKNGEMDEATLKAKRAKLAASMKKMEDPSLIEFMKEMKEVNLGVAGTSKGVKINLDENFCKKFGALKKASVLAYYGRTNEAFAEIAKAAEIVKN